MTVAVYDDLVSKSGAEINLKTPAELIDNSDPSTAKLTGLLSASVAVTVPILVWFSSADRLALEVKLVSYHLSY